MKKLIIACVAVGCLMLTGCSKKNPQPSPTPSATPSTEPTMTPSASPETAEGLKGILEAIRRNDEYQLPMSMDVDDTVLVDMYGLSSDLVKDYAIFMPAMNVHATEIILVEAQDGKLDEVKKALDKRMETVEHCWAPSRILIWTIIPMTLKRWRRFLCRRALPLRFTPQPCTTLPAT